MSFQLLSYNVESTIDFGLRIGALLKPNDILLLNGDLGAGKTQFSKGVAQALQIKEEITSPTFPILNEYYSGELPFFHFDFYRLTNFEELQDLDFDYIVESGGVSLIEWGKMFQEYIIQDYIEFEFKKLGDESRQISLLKSGSRSLEITDALS